jgi:hypothetical protein
MGQSAIGRPLAGTAVLVRPFVPVQRMPKRILMRYRAQDRLLQLLV